MIRRALLAFLILASAMYGARSAEKSVQFGAVSTSSPWIICVYDANNQCQPFLHLPSTGGGALVPSANGGTGVNNGSSTLTVGGNFTMSGAYPFVGTLTGSTNVTFPTSGTLATTTSPLGLVVGSSPIASGTNGYIEYDNSGVLGELATTGSGNVVLSTSPALVTPTLGTPASGNLANTNGYAATNLNGLGTGVGTALGVNIGTAGSPVVNGGALGTPSSGVGTNITGVPLTSGITGTLGVTHGGTGATTSTGSGAVVLATSPTLVTPNLGIPTAINLGNATNLPISAIPGLGTNVATALGLNASGSASLVLTNNATLVNPTLTGPTMTSPILGTPFTGNMVNTTGYLASNLGGLGTGVGTALGQSVTGSSGIVLNTSPTINAPTINMYRLNSATSRTTQARIGDTFNPKDFGATGTGSVVTAGTALGISTLAGLAAVAGPDGSHPYSFLTSGVDPAGATNDYPFGTLFNLPISVAASSSALTLNFGVTTTIGESSPVLTTTISSTTIPVNTWGLTVGKTITGSGISGSPTVASTILSGSLVASSAQSLTAGAVLTFNTSTVQGGYAAFVANGGKGVYQGMKATGTGVPANTYVEHVNYSTGEVRFNQVVTVAAGASVTFVQPWLSNVVAGMKVYAGSSSAVGTVSTVNTSTGAVTLSASTLPALNPVAPYWDASAQADGNNVTFFAPFTNTQATALSMDWLGSQAAIQAAIAATSAKVVWPSGTYVFSSSLVGPTQDSNNLGDGQTGVSLFGQGREQTVFEPANDLGPGVPLVSSGDPSGMWDNQRGMYGTLGMNWGTWSGFQVLFPGTTFAVGARPTVGGVPINMSGMRFGSRLTVEHIFISGFNHGRDTAGCHVIVSDLWAIQNFDGRYEMAGTNCEFDYTEYSTWDIAAWAAWAIDPYGSIGGETDIKPYMGFTPYGIYLESGYDTSPQFLSTNFSNNYQELPDFEANGCGAFVDGNIQPNNDGTNPRHTVSGITWRRPYSNLATPPVMPGGCTQHKVWIDLGTVGGWDWQDLPAYDSQQWAPISGGYGLFRFNNTDAQFYGNGGVKLSGAGIQNLVQTYGTACQEIATTGNQYDTGAVGYGGALGYTNGAVKIGLEVPGVWRGTIVPLLDSGATTLPPGTILESVQALATVLLGGQRAGQASAGTAYLQGVTVGSYGSCDMRGAFVPVATSGSTVPIQVPAQEAVGTLLKVGTATPGTAAVASTLTDGINLGVVNFSANSGSSALNYMIMRPLGP